MKTTQRKETKNAKNRRDKGHLFAHLGGLCVFAFLYVSIGVALAEPLEIVVSAPKLDDLDLMAVDTAADVTRIEREAIEQSGATSVPEVLQTEANLLMSGYSGKPSEGQISLRGFGENSHTRVLVTVDGHKVNRPDMGGIEWQQIPLGNVESIEVVRGGQNVLYGNHALAGVVKITSKKGGERSSHFSSEVGSFGYRRVTLNYSDRLGDSFLSSGINTFSEEGFRSNSAERATSFNASMGWYLNDTDTLTLRGSYSDGFTEYPGPLNSVGNGFNETKSGLLTMLWDTERERGAGRVSSGLSFKDTDWALDGIDAHQQLLSASLGPRYRFGDENNFWILGTDVQYDGIEHSIFVPEHLTLQEPRTYVSSEAKLSRVSAAPYLFAQRKWQEKWTLNGGVRYEVARTDNLLEEYEAPYFLLFGTLFPNPAYGNPPTVVFDDALTDDGWATELSLAYDFNKRLSAWGGYDRVYRYPTLDESAAYQGHPLSDPLNKNLSPETGNQVELGLRFKNEQWQLSANSFLMLMDNEIGFSTNQNLNVNIGATRRIGTDLEAKYQWNRWLGFSTRWALVDARLDYGEHDGNTVPMVPSTHGVSAITLTPIKKLIVSLNHRYISSQYIGGDFLNTKTKLEPYQLLGLSANWAFDQHTRLFVNVYNLLDENHMASAYGSATYPGSGRRISVGATIGF